MDRRQRIRGLAIGLAIFGAMVVIVFIVYAIGLIVAMESFGS